MTRSTSPSLHIIPTRREREREKKTDARICFFFFFVSQFNWTTSARKKEWRGEEKQQKLSLLFAILRRRTLSLSLLIFFSRDNRNDYFSSEKEATLLASRKRANHIEWRESIFQKKKALTETTIHRGVSSQLMKSFLRMCTSKNNLLVILSLLLDFFHISKQSVSSSFVLMHTCQNRISIEFEKIFEDLQVSSQ